MPGYLNFTENEDGTTTVTTNLHHGDQELTFVLPHHIKEFGTLLYEQNGSVHEMVEVFEQEMIQIPNEV